MRSVSERNQNCRGADRPHKAPRIRYTPTKLVTIRSRCYRLTCTALKGVGEVGARFKLRNAKSGTAAKATQTGLMITRFEITSA